MSAFHPLQTFEAGAKLLGVIEGSPHGRFLVSEIAERMNVPAAEEEDVEEMKRTVAPEAVLDAIEESERVAE